MRMISYVLLALPCEGTATEYCFTPPWALASWVSVSNISAVVNIEPIVMSLRVDESWVVFILFPLQLDREATTQWQAKWLSYVPASFSLLQTEQHQNL